jgi:hypothetical protein
MKEMLPALRRAISERVDAVVSLDVTLWAAAAEVRSAVRTTARVIDEAYMVCSGVSYRGKGRRVTTRRICRRQPARS